jgi:hypothetical protein
VVVGRTPESPLPPANPVELTAPNLVLVAVLLPARPKGSTLLALLRLINPEALGWVIRLRMGAATLLLESERLPLITDEAVVVALWPVSVTVVVVLVRVTSPLEVLLALDVRVDVPGRRTSLVGSLIPIDAKTWSALVPVVRVLDCRNVESTVERDLMGSRAVGNTESSLVGDGRLVMEDVRAATLP